jgi:hypothetical protein
VIPININGDKLLNLSIEMEVIELENNVDKGTQSYYQDGIIN